MKLLNLMVFTLLKLLWIIIISFIYFLPNLTEAANSISLKLSPSTLLLRSTNESTISSSVLIQNISNNSITLKTMLKLISVDKKGIVSLIEPNTTSEKTVSEILSRLQISINDQVVSEIVLEP